MNSKESQADLAVSLARRDLYLFISAALMPPGDRAFRLLDDHRFRAVVEGAIDIIRDDVYFRPPALGLGEIDPAQAVLEIGREGDPALSLQYLWVFGHGISKTCPPYETEYCANRDITFRSQQMADIAGFYRAFGLNRAAASHERLDHISIEAEFMAVLITRELHAVVEELGEEKVCVCQDAQRKFFQEHIGWWLPAFGMLLEKNAADTFYGSVGRFLRAFVPAERAFFELPPFREVPNANVVETTTDDSCAAAACGTASID